LGFIGGTTFKSVINKETIKTGEVSLLTVHSKLRNKRLAPILIKEIQRRFNLAGVWQGMFCTKIPNPGQYAVNTFLARPLNVKRMSQQEFLVKDAKSTIMK